MRETTPLTGGRSSRKNGARDDLHGSPERMQGLLSIHRADHWLTGAAGVGVHTPTDWFGTLAILAAATALLFCAPHAAAAQERASGIQLTPDSHGYLINKDVGDERWAIAFDLDSRTITGNVFYPDGRAPRFLWCEQVSAAPDADPAQSEITVACYAAAACDRAPCDSDAWTYVAQVPVSGSFLLPPGTGSTLSGNVQPILSQSCATSMACHSSEGRTPRLSPGRTAAETVDVAALQNMAKSYVAAFDPDGSYLFDKILGIASSGAVMPPDAAPLDAAQTEAIRRWIVEGAVDY